MISCKGRSQTARMKRTAQRLPDIEMTERDQTTARWHNNHRSVKKLRIPLHTRTSGTPSNMMMTQSTADPPSPL